MLLFWLIQWNVTLRHCIWCPWQPHLYSMLWQIFIFPPYIYEYHYMRWVIPDKGRLEKHKIIFSAAHYKSESRDKYFTVSVQFSWLEDLYNLKWLVIFEVTTISHYQFNQKNRKGSNKFDGQESTKISLTLERTRNTSWSKANVLCTP